MMYLLKLLLYCFCLSTLNVRALKADGSFEDADQVNEFITMSFSSSHPYDLRQTIPGEPEIDYPIYSAVPKTNFDCNGRHEGYYADIQARCQVFRICANTDLVGKGFAFLCPNGTLFSQKNFVCDWYRNVDCSDSERYYSKNDNNRIGTRSDMMKTVRQMMEHPMKTISIALNRGKSTTLQSTTSRINIATRPTKAYSNFKISTPEAISRLPVQDSFSIENLPINLNQDEIGSGFSSPLQETFTTPETNILTPPSRGGLKPINAATLNITPPSPTFSPPFETPLSPPTYEIPLSSDNISYDTYSSATQAGLPLSPTEDSASEREVYVSSLGELSTDPGANFNRQTSRVIANPPSNALDIETKASSANGMNFAQKVNAGLNGLQVVNHDEVIAPEYVKNIMQSNVGLPQQPPVSFDFASNINSLLDEVNYEAQLGNSAVQYQQLQTRLQKEPISVTKKPFRFLSRGFSHEKSKDGGSYVYGPTTSSRSRHRTVQHSTSTQSYNNSLITTLLTTTQSPVTSPETTQSLSLENASENLNIESAVELSTKSKAPSVESNPSNALLEDKNVLNLLDIVQNDELEESEVVKKPVPELEPKLDSKSAIKREPKELKQLDSVDSVKELSPELDDQGKVNVNKRAEDLLLAGVKQIAVSEPDEKSKTTEDEASLPIVPIYNRATAPQTSTPHITSSSTTSTISTTTTTSSLLTTTASSSISDIPSTTPSTTTEASLASSTTFEPTTTPAVSIRRFTVGSGQQRRLTSRPISYSRKNNSNRSGSRTTLTTKSTTTTVPSYRGRSGARSTSTTSAPPNTTKITISPRRRLNVNRYTYGSRRRTTESSSSTSSSTTTTTATPPSKKLNVRSSDSSLSDLTAVASTYNAVSNRAYNSIRQNSIKYTQTKRRRPNHTNVTSETTTTTKPSIKNFNTQQPRSSLTTTLAPFSHHEAISPIPTSSTTPETLPATFLSFNDLTKSITDDSILQTLRKNQASSKQLVDSSAFRTQQQALPRQQIPYSTVSRIQQDHSTQRPPLSEATILPFIPLKDFIASKFGAQYSPEPPKLSTSRPALITQSFNNDYVLKTQKKPIYDLQYSKQQYGGVRQEFAPQTNQAIKLSTPVQYTVRNPLSQNVFQQQSQQNVQQQTQQQQQQQLQQQLQQQQQQQVQQQLQQQQLHQQQQQKQQYQEQQLRLQQQQQKLQQLKQQQNHLQQQYQLQQQQQQQQQQKLQQQKLQQHQVQTQQYFSTNQQQIFPAQQYNQLQQTIPTQTIQQQQRIPIQHRNSMHQISTKIVPSVEQQFQIQRSQQIQPPQQKQQQRQQSQIQIIPSQMTISQTIPPQQLQPANNQNINLSSNVKPEIGSINVRLPSNLAGLIPNTNIFELSRNSNSLESAQRRSDQQTFEDAYGARERKSAYAGVSSYDVPLSSVGRLTNDMSYFLRQRRL